MVANSPVEERIRREEREAAERESVVDPFIEAATVGQKALGESDPAVEEVIRELAKGNEHSLEGSQDFASLN